MTTAEVAASVSATTKETSESIRTWALVALALYLVNGVAFAGFSAVGGIWYTISDAAGLLLAISIMVLVVRFDDLFRTEVGSISRTARWIGVAAMSLGVLGSLVLLTSQVSHAFIPPAVGLGMQFAGWGLLGVWFILMGVMATRSGRFSDRWVKVAYFAGAGSVVAMSASIPLGPDSPVVSVGFTVAFLSIILWVVRTRKELGQG